MLPFIRANARWLAGGVLLTFASSFGQTFFIALSAGELRAAFDLTHGEFGRLYMLATLGSAATLPFLGRIVDWTSVRNTLLLTVPLLALACVLIAVAPNVAVLVLALYGLRLFGQGMMTHIAMTAMGKWYAAQRGRAVSLVAIGHQLGEMLMPLAFVGLLALGFGWRGVWVGAALVLVLAALPTAASLFAVERVPGRGANAAGTVATGDLTRGQVMRDPVFWIAMTGVLAPAFIGTSMFFHQTYLIELRGWSPVAFAGGFTVLGVVTVTMTLVAGRLVDRFGAVSLLPLFLLPLGASCLVLGVGEGAWAIPAFFALMGLAYGTSQTLFGALWPEIYGTAHLGAIRSTVVAMMVFSTALGPAVTGTLIDRGVALPTQMIGYGGYCLAVSLVLVWVARTVRGRRAVAAPPAPA